MRYKNPKGTSIIAAIIATVVVVLTGGLGLALLAGANAIFCSVDVFWGCNNNVATSAGGGGGGTVITTPIGSPGTSPTINETNGFYARPPQVPVNGTTTLYWNADNATTCVITNDAGVSTSGGGSGSVSTLPLDHSTIFTLTCENGTGGPTDSANLRVIIIPRYQEI